MTPIAPGSNIGIVGGGQLGRMLAIAAAQLGYRVHVYADQPSGPAADVSAKWVQGSYSDVAALAAFAKSVSVVTFEFENIEPGPLKALSDAVPLRPNPRALEIGQDRIAEKRFAAECGGRTADWAEVNSLSDLETALVKIGAPAILKTVRFGYDGKGQARINEGAGAAAAWEALGSASPLILEAFVPFTHEYSLIVARDMAGSVAFWDAPENIHRDGILATSTVPGGEAVRIQIPAARAFARRVAERLDYVGVLAIEFFAGSEGPVFNEMAPRVHNSGHWTIEGAFASQFENHIRAIVGLPLASTRLAAKSVLMENLIGNDVERWRDLAADGESHLHLYGKHDARPGRKMGHVTRITV